MRQDSQDLEQRVLVRQRGTVQVPSEWGTRPSASRPMSLGGWAYGLSRCLASSRTVAAGSQRPNRQGPDSVASSQSTVSRQQQPATYSRRSSRAQGSTRPSWRGTEEGAWRGSTSRPLIAWVGLRCPTARHRRSREQPHAGQGLAEPPTGTLLAAPACQTDRRRPEILARDRSALGTCL